MSPAPSLTWPDYAVLLASLAVLIIIGAALSRQQHDTADFFLARRRVPWWAACLSFLATEISAVTIISVPATAYSENWEYVQFFIGSSLAKLAVAFLFIPAFYRHQVTTIYEFLSYRFGAASQVTGSIFFFITRLAGSGVRLMAAALAVSVLIDGVSFVSTYRSEFDRIIQQSSWDGLMDKLRKRAIHTTVFERTPRIVSTPR